MKIIVFFFLILHLSLSCNGFKDSVNVDNENSISHNTELNIDSIEIRQSLHFNCDSNVNNIDIDLPFVYDSSEYMTNFDSNFIPKSYLLPEIANYYYIVLDSSELLTSTVGILKNVTNATFSKYLHFRRRLPNISIYEVYLVDDYEYYIHDYTKNNISSPQTFNYAVKLTVFLYLVYNKSAFIIPAYYAREYSSDSWGSSPENRIMKIDKQFNIFIQDYKLSDDGVENDWELYFVETNLFEIKILSDGKIQVNYPKRINSLIGNYPYTPNETDEMRSERLKKIPEFWPAETIIYNPDG